MTAHVSDDALVDLALGEGAAPDRAHAGSCADCARRLEEAKGALELARRAEVPEPSPLYWDALRRGVSQRIAEEKARRRHFAILVPLAAAAALVAVVFTWPASRPRDAAPPPLAAWSALPLVEDDDSLRVLEGLALASGELAEWDEASGLGAYLANLTDEESQALAETLRERGQGGES
jgi:hypothetical protein